MCRGRKWYALIGVIGGLAVLLLGVRPTHALYLDEGKTMQLAGVFYNQVRFRTEEPRGLNANVGDWSLMQHRYYVDPQFQAEVLPWLRQLPVGAELMDMLQIDGARFFFNPRFEYDGIYDYGPDAFRDDLSPSLQKGNRLQIFEIYGQVEMFDSRLNIRGGRQNLSWGETDIFRLLDRINPLDDGFGGFLLDLDERRRPLTMLRVGLGLGDIPEWDVYNNTLEAFIAPDKRLGAGVAGAWGVASDAMSPELAPTYHASLGDRTLAGAQLDRPDVSLQDSRWGVRFMTTWKDIIFTLAHLSTYPDAPTLSLESRVGEDGLDPIFKLRFPNIQVTGLSASGPVSSFQVPVLRDLTYTIFRTEIAGFFGEPFFIEDINMAMGRRLPKRDVIRAVLGFDHTQWIRPINPYNTFSFSVQQFYSNIQGNTRGMKVPLVTSGHEGKPLNRFVDVDKESLTSTAIISSLFNASYFFNLAQIQPQFVYVYNWEGAWLFQPGLTFIRDPWRLRIQWNWIDGRLVDVGLLQDKDNLAIRIDYLL